MGSGVVKILFVCMGNICRSPVAEAVFRHLVTQRGLAARFHIDSAGISAYHSGDPPDQRSTEVARRRGIELAGRSRPLRRKDLEDFDYVIVMDAENREGVERLIDRGVARAAVHRLREFDPEAQGEADVPDPYYGGTRGFEHVHDIAERSCSALLEHIIQQHRLEERDNEPA